MRMRKKKNLVPRMERCGTLLIEQPAEQKGKWRELYPDCADVRLEIGCGKGRFTCETADANPQSLFVAIERVPDAMIIAMERARSMELTNVFFIDADAAKLNEYFEPDEVDMIYLNFSDPWPSNRHAPRRLTHVNFLAIYRNVLKTGGEIQFKTDNVDLFEFSVQQFPKASYELREVTRNLHENGICGVMTDYESKFHELGKTICRCVAKKLPAPESQAADSDVPASQGDSAAEE
jgi:tRNA (guanine-N7-)-methyltransferase